MVSAFSALFLLSFCSLATLALRLPCKCVSRWYPDGILDDIPMVSRWKVKFTSLEQQHRVLEAADVELRAERNSLSLRSHISSSCTILSLGVRATSSQSCRVSAESAKSESLSQVRVASWWTACVDRLCGLAVWTAACVNQVVSQLKQQMALGEEK
jgi:hypothetical protein